MTTNPETNAEVEANCKIIRQLKWLQNEQWEHYDYEIKKLVDRNEALLKAELKTAQAQNESVSL